MTSRTGRVGHGGHRDVPTHWRGALDNIDGLIR